MHLFRVERISIVRCAIAASAAALMALSAASSAAAAKFKIVHSFCSKTDCNDGGVPLGPLWMDSSGNIFGVTKEEGRHVNGAAYELQRQADGSYKYMAFFAFPYRPPEGGLVLDTQGNFYGELSDGEFYKLSFGFGKHHDKWGLTQLQVSCLQRPDCGINRLGGLMYRGASAGTPWDGVSPLYGVAAAGGLNGGGTVFRLKVNGNQGTITVLYNFCSQGGSECLDGNGPNGIFLDASRNLYGTASGGGGHDDGNTTGGAGVVFELSPGGARPWIETVLHSFCSADNCTDGAFPTDGVTLDSAGSLFGVTVGGGSCKADPGGCGTIFKLVPTGMNSPESVLYSFCSKRECRDGRNPDAKPLVDAFGNIFGTTVVGGDSEFFSRGGGVVYELSGSSFRVLHAFCSITNCEDGVEPDTTLVADSAGHLYGSTPFGGKSSVNGYGEVYQMTP
jgi:uncharacterized repeat protein (TIGR03803 family)